MKKKRLLLLFLILILLHGCQADYGRAIEVSDISSDFKSYKEAEIEERILSESEKTALNYADGLYLNDYSEVKKQIEKEATKYYEKISEGVFSVPVLMKIVPKLYSKGYEVYQNEKLSYEEFLKKYPEYFIRVEYYFAVFEDEGFEDKYKNRENYENIESAIAIGKMEDGDKYYGYYNVEIFDLASFDSSFAINTVNFTPEKWYKAIENRFGKSIGTFDSLGLVKDEYREEVETIIENLHEKYNVMSSEMFELLSRYTFIFRYKMIDFIVVSGVIHDNVGNIFHQKIISDCVNRIIEEEGMADSIGQFTYTVTGDDNAINIPEALEDIEGYLKSAEIYDPQISLYYLLEEGEEPDYETVRTIINRIDDSIAKEERFFQYYVFFYDMNELDQKTQLILFKEADQSGFNKASGGLSNWQARSHVVDSDHDCFSFLYTFGKKREGVLWSFGSINRNIDIEIIKETNIRDDL